MDYRCPSCGEDLGKRKLAHSIIAKMEIDCPRCMSRVQMNVHSVEAAVMVLYFAGFVGLVALGYLLDRRELLATGVVVGLLGWGAVYAIERVYLRAWPRYVLAAPKPTKQG